MTSLTTWLVKNLPAVQETQDMQVRSLGLEDPLEREKPTPGFLPEKFHGQRSLWAIVQRVTKNYDVTEQLSMHIQVYIVTLNLVDSVSSLFLFFSFCGLMISFYYVLVFVLFSIFETTISF